jgi:hypothetical protein
MRGEARERGSALLVVLLVLVLLTVLGSALLFVSTTDGRTAENERFAAEALHLAEAGARQAKRWFDHPASTGHAVAFPAAGAVDRTLRRIDVDGEAGPTAAVPADGSPARPYYKDDLFDRPFRGSQEDALLGTSDGPDVRIDDASGTARAFLDDLSEKLLPSASGALRVRIARIDVYAPPYRRSGGAFVPRGVATVAVVARVLRAADGAVLAESRVTTVLDEIPYAAAYGPLHTCGDLAWTGAPPARWGAVTAAGTVTLPADHTLVPASLARAASADPRIDLLRYAAPEEEALFLAYKEKIESQDGGLVLEDPWLRIVSGGAFGNAPACAGGTPEQPCPFSWNGASDLAGGQLPSHTGMGDGSHASLLVAPTTCPVFDYSLFKRIAASGDRDAHLFTWESGTTFRDRATGEVGDVRDLTDGRTGMFFFDTRDGRPPRDTDADGVLDNLTPGISIEGGTWGARGALYWNGETFRVEGAAGREATATPPGEPFRDANGNGVFDPGERCINLAYATSLDGTMRGSAVDPFGGGVVRNAAGPGIPTTASFWGLLHASGSLDLTGGARILGTASALGSVTESRPGAPALEIYWDQALASGWPPEGWDLPRVHVVSWRTEP